MDFWLNYVKWIFLFSIPVFFVYLVIVAPIKYFERHYGEIISYTLKWRLERGDILTRKEKFIFRLKRILYCYGKFVAVEYYDLRKILAFIYDVLIGLIAGMGILILCIWIIAAPITHYVAEYKYKNNEATIEKFESMDKVLKSDIDDAESYNASLKEVECSLSDGKKFKYVDMELMWAKFVITIDDKATSLRQLLE